MIKKFLKSKIQVGYAHDCATPWYKGFWYYNLERDENMLVIIPLL